MKIPYKLNHEVPTMNWLTQLYADMPTQLDFDRTYFMRPAVLAPIALYLFENPKVVLASASPPIKKFFQTYGLLKQRIPAPSHVFPLNYLKNAEEISLQLDRFVPTHIGAYLKPLLQILAPATYCGHSNAGGGWLFFSVCSSKIVPLDDFRWHMLLEEFEVTGGRFWALQQNRYFNGRKTLELDGHFPKTWVIFGFPLTKLGA